MKNNPIALLIPCIILSVILFYSCKKGTNENIIKKEKLSGYVQKGPYINGTQIELYELNSSLVQTGKTFSTQISNNTGSFDINQVALSSKYVEFSASGYYFNEVTGDISIAPLTLNALSDITDITSVNINILTSLEKKRVEYLVKNGMSFAVAKDSAQQQVLAIFGFRNKTISHSENLDISLDKQENAILLAISLILQGDRSAGDLTELLANITTDIQQNGNLNSDAILTSLRNSTKRLDLITIRSNLEKRYHDLGIITTIPQFERYINDFLSFTGQKPVASTKEATSITTSNAILNGEVNANDLSTNVIFEYGTSTDYGNTVTVSQSPITGHTNTQVSVDISGLAVATSYHFRIKSINSLGTVYGSDMSFSTLGKVPAAITLPATSLFSASAILNATVNANYLETTVTFEYGETTSYGIEINAVQSPLTGNVVSYVSAAISGLTKETTYHCRVKAVNFLGTTYGDDQSFTTTIVISTGIITDYDGNVYQTIRIGDQIWMAENLKTTKYNNGDLIGTSTTPTEDISGENTPIYQWAYAGDVSYVSVYGRLYTWYAVTDSRKICPTGWHIPSDAEFTTLTNFAADYGSTGVVLKESGTVHFQGFNTNPTNILGFTALPGGYRNIYGLFGGITDMVEFWSSSESNTSDAKDFTMSSVSDYAGLGEMDKKFGHSIRCIKD
jgi:uncharacterized protein (TIGR02145 family)